jgi:hypothetical protein
LDYYLRDDEKLEVKGVIIEMRKDVSKNLIGN